MRALGRGRPGQRVGVGNGATVEGLLEERGALGAGNLRAGLGVSKSHLGRLIAPLVGQGRIVREGRGAATTYRLAGQHGANGVDPRWERALDIARREGRVTRTALAAAAGVSERTATRVLGAMVDARVLVDGGGRGRASGYVIDGLKTNPEPPSGEA